MIDVLHTNAARPSFEVAPSTDVRESQADATASRITGVAARTGERELGGRRQVAIGTGQGRGLDDGTRTQFESSLGRDLRHVRVHTDDAAGRSALDMRAAAYTVDSHVYFAPGQFAPHTSAGSHLLAHELAHVLQNSERGTPQVIRRAPLPAAVANSSEHQNLMQNIMTAKWSRAASLLNAYSIDGIHSVFEGLSKRQIESLYLGAIENDAVGGGSNIAKEALAASPELQTAVAAVTAAGITIKEFVDLQSKMTRGDLMSRYGFWRYRTIRDIGRALPDKVLAHVVMAEDTTLYLQRSGRVATDSDEKSQKLQEFKPHGVTGTATGLGARAFTDDPDKIEAAAGLGDNVGDLGGALAQTGAARTQNKDISASGARAPDTSGQVVGKGGSTATGKGNYVSPKVGGPLPPTAGITQKPLPPVKVGTTGAPQNVKDAAVKAMAADPKRGSGVGGEAAAMESRKGEGAGFDLNQLKGKGGNFPALDFTNPQGLYSAKTKDVGKALSANAIKAYMNDLDTLVDTGGPGFATTTAQKAAALLATNRDAIQKANAWPAALPKDATEAQILQEIARNGKVVIPDDHVGPVRDAIGQEVARNPHRWPDQDVAHLQQRIQPMGITSGELDRLHKEGK